MAREPDLPLAELALPPDNSACGAGCALVFVGAFVALAIVNLTSGTGVPLVGHVASVLWLALVALCVGLALWSAGLRGTAVACLGPFSKRHFADARRAGDAPLLGFGYELFGRRWYFLRLRPELRVSVTMNTGQATALAGRDMRDWSVVLRYRAARAVPNEGHALDEVYVVGPARERARTAELSASVVAFLRAAGVELLPGTSETEFRTPPVDTN